MSIAIKSNFKTGDWVVRTAGSFGGMEIGDIGQIIHPSGIIKGYRDHDEYKHDLSVFRFAILEEIPIQESPIQKIEEYSIF